MNWKAFLGFLRGLAKSPKTTAAGVGSIAIGVTMIAHDPVSLTTGTPIASIFAGLGLLMAADQKNAPVSDQ